MFSYSQGRGAQHAQKLYAGVQPGTVLMIDGYELYNGIAHDHQLVHLGYCSLTRLPSAQASANRQKGCVVVGCRAFISLRRHRAQPPGATTSRLAKLARHEICRNFVLTRLALCERGRMMAVFRF